MALFRRQGGAFSPTRMVHFHRQGWCKNTVHVVKSDRHMQESPSDDSKSLFLTVSVIDLHVIDACNCKQNINLYFSVSWCIIKTQLTKPYGPCLCHHPKRIDVMKRLFAAFLALSLLLPVLLTSCSEKNPEELPEQSTASTAAETPGSEPTEEAETTCVGDRQRSASTHERNKAFLCGVLDNSSVGRSIS